MMRAAFDDISVALVPLDVGAQHDPDKNKKYFLIYFF